MPVRLRLADPVALEAALAARRSGDLDRSSTKLLVKHYLAVLAERAPGGAVEVRVPPYAAVQAIPGVRHTRGTPPAVVETDAATWLALALGESTWEQVRAAGAVHASGERSDLGAWLPLT